MLYGRNATEEDISDDLLTAWQKLYISDMFEKACMLSNESLDAILAQMKTKINEKGVNFSRRMSIEDMDSYIASLPSEGEIYCAERIQSFSDNPYFSEGILFCDQAKYNVKIIVTPNAGDTNAKVLSVTGRHDDVGTSEVLYSPFEKFILLSKGWEKTKDQITKELYDQYVIYLKEMPNEASAKYSLNSETSEVAPLKQNSQNV